MNQSITILPSKEAFTGNHNIDQSLHDHYKINNQSIHNNPKIYQSVYNNLKIDPSLYSNHKIDQSLYDDHKLDQSLHDNHQIDQSVHDNHKTDQSTDYKISLPYDNPAASHKLTALQNPYKTESPVAV